MESKQIAPLEKVEKKVPSTAPSQNQPEASSHLQRTRGHLQAPVLATNVHTSMHVSGHVDFPYRD